MRSLKFESRESSLAGALVAGRSSRLAILFSFLVRGFSASGRWLAVVSLSCVLTSAGLSTTSVLAHSALPTVVHASAPLLVQDRGSVPALPRVGISEQVPEPRPISPEERGDIFMARKAYADAADYYHRALRQVGASSGGSATLWNKLGIAYQQAWNFGAARKAYREAIRRRENFSEAWNNLGTTYFLAHRFGKSVRYYRRAIELEPDSAPFHLNLGTSYYRMKKPKEAVEEYRQALTLDSNILVEHSSTATVVGTRGDDVEYFFYMAKVLASLERTEEAVRYLRRAFEDGFRDVKRLDADPDFVKISKDPSYIALRNNPPMPIRD